MGAALALKRNDGECVSSFVQKVDAGEKVVKESGQRAEFSVGELYQRYAPLIYRRILRFFDKDEAEEVLQEVFVKVIENRDQFRGEAEPSTWLYKVATHHCLNVIRNKGRRRELWKEHKTDLWYAQCSAGEQEARILLKEIWKKVPQDLVNIAFYFYVDGMTHAEIARIVGVSRRTVGNRLLEFDEAARKAASSR